MTENTAALEIKTVWVPMHGEEPAIRVRDLKPGMTTIQHAGFDNEVAEITVDGDVYKITYVDGCVDRRELHADDFVAVKF